MAEDSDAVSAVALSGQPVPVVGAEGVLTEEIVVTPQNMAALVAAAQVGKIIFVSLEYECSILSRSCRTGPPPPC